MASRARQRGDFADSQGLPHTPGLTHSPSYLEDVSKTDVSSTPKCHSWLGGLILLWPTKLFETLWKQAEVSRAECDEMNQQKGGKACLRCLGTVLSAEGNRAGKLSIL